MEPVLTQLNIIRLSLYLSCRKHNCDHVSKLKGLKWLFTAYQVNIKLLSCHSRPSKMWMQYMIPFLVYPISFIPSVMHLFNTDLFLETHHMPSILLGALVTEGKRHELVLTNPMLEVNCITCHFTNIPCFLQSLLLPVILVRCLLALRSFPTLILLCSVVTVK